MGDRLRRRRRAGGLREAADLEPVAAGELDDEPSNVGGGERAVAVERRAASVRARRLPWPRPSSRSPAYGVRPMLWPPACTEAKAIARVVFTRRDERGRRLSRRRRRSWQCRACTVEPSFSSTACHEISVMLSAIPRCRGRTRSSSRPSAARAACGRRCPVRRHRFAAPASTNVRLTSTAVPSVAVAVKVAPVIGRDRAALHVDVRRIRELDDLPPHDVAARVVGPELQVGGARQVAGDDVIAAVLELGRVRRHRPQHERLAHRGNGRDRHVDCQRRHRCRRRAGRARPSRTSPRTTGC